MTAADLAGPLARPLASVARRVLQAVPVILLVITANFFLLHLAPGDMVDALVATSGAADLEYIGALRADYGLDQPLVVRFGRYLARMLSFDLGYSFVYQAPVLTVIGERLPATLLLMSAGLALSFPLGVALGSAAAGKPGSRRDRLIVVGSLLLYAAPGFWVGLMLIVAFAVKLPWFPVGGFETIASPHRGLARGLDVAWHLTLPTVALAVMHVAVFTRLMRASMIDVQSQDFVRTARAKGLSERRVAARHVRRNALLPVVTVLGVQASTLLGGSVVVESVFSLPGVGRLAFDAVMQRDTNLLLGILFLSSLLVIAGNLILDLVYTWLDPRICHR